MRTAFLFLKFTTLLKIFSLKTNHFLFLLLFLGFGTIGFSQEISKDSLAKKVQHLIDEAWEFTLSNNDSSLVVSEKALSLSKQNNYYLGEALSMESIGLYHEIVTGDIETASNHYFEAIELCEEHNLDYIASIFHSLGVMFHTTDNYENALQYYQQSLEKARQQQDSLLIKKCLINLGSVNSSLNDFEKAEEFMKESLELSVRREMDYATYGNLGYLYVKQERFDEAIEVLLKATEESPENPGADLNLYFLLHAKTKAKDSSNMKTALERAKRAAKGDYGLRDKSLLLRNIADYLAFTGNYKEALSYRDQYITVFEEIKEKQRDQIVLETEAKYETEKKDAQLKVLELKNKQAAQQKKIYLFLALGGLLIAGLIGFFLYKNQKKNKQLAQQKKLLEIAVDEKNVLLKETHHRVKNSFQIVSSLLYLQSENITDSDAQNALKEAQNRVRSMVLIHQKLYSKDQLIGIDTKEYLTDLVSDIMESHQEEAKAITYDLNITPMVLAIETITPLGLIVNELVTNVLKHAFTGSSSNPKMQVSLRKKENNLVLQVTDNGAGMPKSINESSFGIKLIRSLSKKLKGTLTYSVNSPQGTIANLEILRYQEL